VEDMQLEAIDLEEKHGENRITKGVVVQDSLTFRSLSSDMMRLMSASSWNLSQPAR
jgi:hypothetical protein